MKASFSLAVASLLGIVNAVNMSRYDPGPGVEPAFKKYLRILYNETEALDATKSFTNFFVPVTGTLDVLGTTASGAKNITKLKQQLLPPNGNQRWSHFPNVTLVMSENSTAKVYYVQGIIDKTIIGGNCSAAYYQSNFTLVKENGVLDLKPHSGNLALYYDFVVNPPDAPSNIQCV